MRYLNLFGKITKIETRYCFNYNSYIIFVVQKRFVAKAIGEDGKNVKKLSRIVNKRVKIVGLPETIEDVETFISAVVYPIKFRSIEINGPEIIINAGQQSKAVLIGRNKSRLMEMRKIIKNFFRKDLRVV